MVFDNCNKDEYDAGIELRLTNTRFHFKVHSDNEKVDQGTVGAGI